jgi:hypothetical protein
MAMKLKVAELPSGKWQEIEGREMRKVLREFLTRIGSRAIMPAGAKKLRRYAVEALRRGDRINDGVADDRYGDYTKGRVLLLVTEVTVIKDGEEMSMDEAKKRGLLDKK